MGEKEQELFKKAWRFLVRETAAGKGFEASSIVIGEAADRGRSTKEEGTA